uniref:Uncharacterized protein n=1 Tax=Anguilla anguilla TaxID=7936 RepID=A0A0E9SD84_ANGAN
MLKFGEWR